MNDLLDAVGVQLTIRASDGGIYTRLRLSEVHRAAYVIANRTDVCVKFDAPLSAPVIVFEKSNGI
jgi:hypothetical protein